jgi:FSR family fosmidomycin resistance protein-like MFS transporter
MTSTTLAAAPARAADFRIIGLVGIAHFVSHIYILILPPLFALLRAEFNVSYTELGAVIALFNILSAALQTPAGYLVDRTSARTVLVGGLVLGAVSLVGAAMAPNFLIFTLMFALLGIANTAYHPADYALLSTRISAARTSQAFSIHIFAGFIGTAITPAAMLILAVWFGWRGAFMAGALLGIAVAVAIVIFGDVLAGREAAQAKADDKKAAVPSGDTRILMTLPVILNLLFFMLIAGVSVGTQNYLIVALQGLWKTPLSEAATALTVYLTLSAFAVLAGGILAARTERHDRVAMIGLAASGLALLPVAFIDFGMALLIGLMAVSGFFNGLIQPSRDMIVKAVTPPGAFGRVFGFVTTGFNIGGILAPPAFGYMMDNGAPHMVILVTALFSLIAIPTVMITVANRKAV